MAMAEKGEISQVGGETVQAHQIHKLRVSSANLSSSYCTISELPNAILNEIFVRLPIKSVIRCRSVCRAWRSIISQTGFSDFYVKSSNFKPVLYYPCYYISPRELFVIQVSEKGYEYDCVRSTVDPKIPDWAEIQPYFTFIGSCNGFICMLCPNYSDRFSVAHIYVSNPISGECIALPVRCADISVRYFFGFSPSDNMFKVLGVYESYSSLDRDVQIITAGVDDKWRILSPDLFRGLENTWDAIVFCSGAFNWTGYGRDATPGVVYAFELGEEKSGQFALPPVFEERTPTLRNFDNQLCVIECRKLTIAIWVMKEYAVPESWTAIVIRRSWIPPELKSYGLNAVAQLPDGRILFAHRLKNYLISFDMKENKCYRIDMCVANSNLFQPAKNL